jgi:hypothetical protein
MSVFMQVSRKRRCRSHGGLGAHAVEPYTHFRRFDVAGAVGPVASEARSARMLGASVRARRRDVSSLIVHLLVVATTMFLFWDLYLLALHAPG